LIDQSFSTHNFRKIFNSENRKGSYLEGKFFPEVEELSQDLKDIKQAFRRLKKQNISGAISEDDYQSEKEKLNKKKEGIITARDQLIDAELEVVSKTIKSKSFSFDVCESGKYSGKSVYAIPKTEATYFAIKQLQQNLKKLYQVKQQNKDRIIPQLKSLLKDPFPKYIIRTDIKSFYESIDQGKLEKKLYDSPSLSFTSKRMIKRILKSYWELPSKPKGIPRGIGVSPYLAELYLKEFDVSVGVMPDLIYYARYVDDIILVFSPSPTSNTIQYLAKMEEYIGELGLSLNTKTKEIDATESTSEAFDYLGYRFKFNNNKAQLYIRVKKINLYKKKLDLIFDDYVSKQHKNPVKYRKLLIRRIRFLTGNVKLLNSKKSVLVGIYYSHRHLDNTNFLGALDGYLLRNIHTKITNPQLKNRLLKIKFSEGFNKRIFRKFTTKQLSEITEVWKDA